MAKDRDILIEDLKIRLHTLVAEVLPAKNADEMAARPSVFDGPVLKLHFSPMLGATLALYCDDGDNVDSLALQICRAMPDAISCGDAEMPAKLYLTFDRMEPILDEADFRIGEMLRYTHVYCSHTTLAAE
jgi:hypothetical protein